MSNSMQSELNAGNLYTCLVSSAVTAPRIRTSILILNHGVRLLSGRWHVCASMLIVVRLARGGRCANFCASYATGFPDLLSPRLCTWPCLGQSQRTDDVTRLRARRWDLSCALGGELNCAPVLACGAAPEEFYGKQGTAPQLKSSDSRWDRELVRRCCWCDNLCFCVHAPVLPKCFASCLSAAWKDQEAFAWILRFLEHSLGIHDLIGDLLMPSRSLIP